MNRSLELQFLPGGEVSLNLSGAVQGFQAVVQNALVNLLTSAGSDSLYSDRGTGLLSAALSGGIFNTRSAAHEANFAASNTLFFSREHESADTADKLEGVVLTPSFLGMGRIEVEASFQSVSGTVLSFPIPVSPSA